MRNACRTCGVDVQVIVDDLGFSHVIEPVGLSVVGEALAVLSGRRTWARSQTRRAADQWWLRDRWTIGTPSHRLIVTAHVCDAEIPDAWRVADAPSRPVADPEECPF